MTKRSKFNKYARKVATNGNPLSQFEWKTKQRRQSFTAPNGRRFKHRAAKGIKKAK